MTGARIQRRPTFLWQAGLILLPVLLLSVLGWFSLRKDRFLARRQAEDRAQVVADNLAESIEKNLSGGPIPTNTALSFQIDGAGRLIFPPPYEVVPEPAPLNEAALNPEQERLWRDGQTAEMEGRPRAIAAYRSFLDSNPPPDFAAAAHYRLGLRLGLSQEAVEQFKEVLQYAPTIRGESGLPLQPLARLKLLRLTALAPGSAEPERFASVNSFCSNVVFYPTPLTPELLRQVEILPEVEKASPTNSAIRWLDILRWRSVWQAHEVSRQLFAAASPDLRTQAPLRLLNPEVNVDGGHEQDGALVKAISPASFSAGSPSSRMVWFSTESPLNNFTIHGLAVSDQRWLAVQADGDGTNCWFVCHSESQLGALANDLATQMKNIPDYFGFGVEIGGRRIAEFAPSLAVWNRRHYSYKGGGDWEKVYLGRTASDVLATGGQAGAGADQIKVTVYLTSPAALFSQQRARAIWLALLVAASTLGALTGLIAAYRAFHRQLRLNDLKSNFVSSVSHELRAPIASVRLMAESLERGTVSEPQKQNEYFKFIVQECRRLSSLIENVLDFSRIEQGRKQYEFEPTDIGVLVEQTVKLMQPYAVERGVVLELNQIRQGNDRQRNEGREQAASVPNSPDNHCSADAGKLELVVDGRAIQQALVNLIDNAVKHSAKGQVVTVAVSGAKDQMTGDARNFSINPQPSTINLSVSDCGPGIPAHEQEKIFERFYRLGSELRRETQGVGIGLSIVKHIVEAHGGCVRVESEVGKGSRFTIELPGQQ